MSKYQPKERTLVWKTIAIMVFVIIAIGFSITIFKSCYDDHRNELGLSMMTSIASCSG